jgi:hypothetical protein
MGRQDAKAPRKATAREVARQSPRAVIAWRRAIRGAAVRRADAPAAFALTLQAQQGSAALGVLAPGRPIAVWPLKRTLAGAIGLAALLLAACASKPAPDNPDALACRPPENPEMRSHNYYMRLSGYTQRADAFAACMTKRGYVLDDDELDARMLHFEQVKNAQWLGGDPAWAMRVYRQEQRMNPELWEREPGA